MTHHYNETFIAGGSPVNQHDTDTIRSRLAAPLSPLALLGQRLILSVLVVALVVILVKTLPLAVPALLAPRTRRQASQTLIGSSTETVALSKPKSQPQQQQQAPRFR